MFGHCLEICRYSKSLEEIAQAQLTMCKIFDATLSKALESFVQADMRGVDMLKSEADGQTVLAEQRIFKYITGRPTLSAIELVPIERVTVIFCAVTARFCRSWKLLRFMPSRGDRKDCLVDWLCAGHILVGLLRKKSQHCAWCRQGTIWQCR
jgi:hypothetical protein